MKIDPSRIGFDIDGVVADTMEAFIRLAAEDHAVPTIRPADITEFEVEDCLDLEPAVIRAIFTRLMQEPLAAGLKPMAHAVEVLSDLAQRAPLTFVTARPLAEPIAAWLENELGPEIFASARLVAMGEHDNKGAYIKGLGLSHFVDDRAETCVGLEAQGITPLVFSQPWNLGKHRLPTVNDWLQIRALCLE